MSDTDQNIGLAVAAQMLRIPYQSAHRLVLVGELLGWKVGGRWIVSLASLYKFVRDKRGGANDA